MELAPRDIVSRSIQKEIDEGRGVKDLYVHLDVRHLGRNKILSNLPGIRDIAMQFADIDPVNEPIPVQPAQHYTMGGIDCNAKCETTIKGLYAAGECACISVHGANRLGGNSLLDTVVFGKIAGEQAGNFAKNTPQETKKEALYGDALKTEKDQIQRLFEGSGDADTALLREEMRGLMVDKAFMFRNKDGLIEAKSKLDQLGSRLGKLRPIARYKVFNLDLIRAIELREMLELAEVIVASALSREESRGSHVRLDFPKRDDTRFLKHTLAYKTADGPRIEFSPVKIARWQPEERKY
jgi:succinate dehydrogenase / fumarate reductase flavoprotein subunit